MAATTISRATWVDDTGSGNGTVLNNARLQADVYNRFDAVLAGHIIIGGRISSEGFGTHEFSAGGTGGNILNVRNTSAGTGNYSQVLLGNNITNSAADFAVVSSTWTPSTLIPSDSAILRSTRAGGLSLAALDAAGTVRLYAGPSGVPNLTLSSSVLFADVPLHVRSAGTGAAHVGLRRTDNGVDEKQWLVRIVGTELRIETSNDAISGIISAMSFTRTGLTPTSINAGASLIPLVDNAYSLGTASFGWTDLYARNSVNVGSASLAIDNDDLKVFTSFSGTQNRWTFLRGGRLNPGSDNTNAIGDTTARVAGLFLAPGPLGGVRLIDGVDSARLWYDDGTNEVVISVNSIDVMRADTSSAVFGKSTFAAANQAPIGVNRTGSDGDLVTFSKDGSTQGAISVSGATVSYGTFCGVHYTQLQEGQAEPTLGTLMVSTGRLIDEHASIDAKYVYVEASNHRAQRGVYGVWSGLLTEDGSGYAWARPGAIFQVASLGLFHIRVTDTGGRISNGDYLQASWRPGLAERQIDVSEHFYVSNLLDSTVAKALVDVDWETVEPNEDGVRETLIPCTIHAG